MKGLRTRSRGKRASSASSSARRASSRVIALFPASSDPAAGDSAPPGGAARAAIAHWRRRAARERASAAEGGPKRWEGVQLARRTPRRAACAIGRGACAHEDGMILFQSLTCVRGLHGAEEVTLCSSSRCARTCLAHYSLLVRERVGARAMSTQEGGARRCIACDIEAALDREDGARCRRCDICEANNSL
jgi:hypothetical protein